MAEPTMKAERTTAVENLIVVIEDGCFVLGFDRLLFGVEVALYRLLFSLTLNLAVTPRSPVSPCDVIFAPET
jgi:hypothetical protein